MRYRLASGAVLKLARSLYGKGHIIYTGSVMHVSLNCLFNEVCMRYRLASGAVLKLAPSLYGKGHIMYTDQFYTSPHLLPMLRQGELSGCGTVMSNRKYFHKQIIKPRVQRAVQCSQTGIVATCNMERSIPHIISQQRASTTSPLLHSGTNRKKSGTKVTVDATAEYN